MAKKRITIVGCGKLGTALAMGLRNVISDVEIIGHDKDQSAGKLAVQKKVIDKHQWNLPASVEGSQLIVLAIPHDGLELTFKSIATVVDRGAIITDLCANKTESLRLANILPMDVAFISSDIVLKPPVEDQPPNVKMTFRDAAWTLTPRSGTSPDAIGELAALVSALEASPIFMDAAEHDGLRFAVDPLPAVLGFALMTAVTNDAAWRERKWLAGDVFNTSTAHLERISPAELRAALMQQPAASVHWLNEIMRQLVALRDHISSNNPSDIERLLGQAQQQRMKWLNDWHTGREGGRGAVEIEKPSFMGSLIGQKLAGQLQKKK
jgi:prephenate dehydrogenase